MIISINQSINQSHLLGCQLPVITSAIQVTYEIILLELLQVQYTTTTTTHITEDFLLVFVTTMCIYLIVFQIQLLAS